MCANNPQSAREWAERRDRKKQSNGSKSRFSTARLPITAERSSSSSSSLCVWKQHGKRRDGPRNPVLSFVEDRWEKKKRETGKSKPAEMYVVRANVTVSRRYSLMNEQCKCHCYIYKKMSSLLVMSRSCSCPRIFIITISIAKVMKDRHCAHIDIHGETEREQ